MELSRRLFLQILGGAAVVSSFNYQSWAQKAARSPAQAQTPPWFAPNPPPFPNFSDRNHVIAEAQSISDRLEQYIKDWFDGRVPARIPNEILPQGYDPNDFPTFTILRPEQITWREQWAVREAEEINFNGLRGGFPDPHCTYALLPTMLVPFGGKVILEGNFPHCRFFDLQVTPSFHPEAYRYNGYTGVGEVPIVDADIEPQPGSQNPFRVGANRAAIRRRYRVEFEMAIGNPAELNAAFQPPYYRASGNRRFGGAIQYQGAWGDKQYRPWGHGRGLWDHGSIWLRYYAPDKSKGIFAGVGLPKITYRLADGRQFFIQADWSPFAARVNRRKPVSWTLPENPTNILGAREGWNTQPGIFRVIVEGFARGTGLADQAYVRALDKGVAGRGEDLPAPGNFEPSATSCTYINYLVRGMSIDWGKVIVITGKLPTFPKTRNGERTMTAAQSRYWSLTSYDPAFPDADGYGGAAITSVMDDELILDEQNRYIIVYSWTWTRPRNSQAANGVTWKDWGPTGKQSLTLRWLSVHPEWSFERAPNEQNLGWKGDWASLAYNKNLVGNNDRSGFLSEFQPVIHFMTKEEFEALGDGRINPQNIPVWNQANKR